MIYRKLPVLLLLPLLAALSGCQKSGYGETDEGDPNQDGPKNRQEAMEAWSKKLDELDARLEKIDVAATAEGVSEEARQKWSETRASLESMRGQVNENLTRAREASEGEWEEAQESLTSSYEATREAVERAWKSFGDDRDEGDG